MQRPVQKDEVGNVGDEEKEVGHVVQILEVSRHPRAADLLHFLDRHP